MSERSGVPLSTLAKVEHDRLSLAYDKLQQLSGRLGITMSSLFAEPTDGPEPQPSARRSIGRLELAVRVNGQHYDYGYLCTELRRKRMVPVVGFVRAKTLEEFGPLVKHAGEEFIYVLDGRVEVHTEFYDPVTLDVGQCIYIDSTMGHAYLAGLGCDQAFFIAVCSSAEEGLMESLLDLHKDDIPPATPLPVPQAAIRHKSRGRKKKTKVRSTSAG